MSSQVSYDTIGDSIDGLPIDQLAPSHTEIQILDTLFREKQGAVNKFLSNSKDVLIVGILFIIFSFSQLDSLIIRFVPSAESSPYMLLILKCLLFMFSYFVLKNWYLARK